jgi:DNA-binding NarL/FixJ family response regulator
MHSDVQFVLEMLRAGASGYLLKDSAQEDLAHAIRIVNSQLTFISHGIAGNVIEDYIQHQGTSKAAAQEILTPREQEVLKLLADGLNTKQLASRLEVSVKTIEAHRQHIMEKLGMQSIADLTKYAIREGLTKLEP